MLIAHVLGDFYFQSDKMVKNKKIIKHGIVYTVVAFAVLSVFVGFSQKMFLVLGILSLSHIAVDIVKFFVTHRIKEDKYQKEIFWADQILHLASVFGAWYLFGQKLILHAVFTKNYSFFMQVIQKEQKEVIYLSPILMIFAIILILKPVDIIIEKGYIWDLSKKVTDENTVNKRKLNPGQVIGYLERLIIFVFIILQQYTAIAFVLTAKSLARYDAITKDKITADYYLIGTLLSIISVFIVTFFLAR